MLFIKIPTLNTSPSHLLLSSAWTQHILSNNKDPTPPWSQHCPGHTADACECLLNAQGAVSSSWSTMLASRLVCVLTVVPVPCCLGVCSNPIPRPLTVGMSRGNPVLLFLTLCPALSSVESAQCGLVDWNGFLEAMPRSAELQGRVQGPDLTCCPRLLWGLVTHDPSAFEASSPQTLCIFLSTWVIQSDCKQKMGQAGRKEGRKGREGRWVKGEGKVKEKYGKPLLFASLVYFLPGCFHVHLVYVVTF